MEEAETNRKADREALKEMTARKVAKIEVTGEAIREEMMKTYQEIGAGQEQIMARMDANQAKADDNLWEIRKEIQSRQAEMRSIVNCWIADTKHGRKETMACQRKMEARLDCREPTREEMED
jgi:hypothetical protein